MRIEFGPVTQEIDCQLTQGFNEYAQDVLGHKQEAEDIVCFTLRDDDGALIGAATGRFFWGPFYLKNLWVAKAHRGKGCGRMLVEKVCEYARSHGAAFIYLATLNFQAPEFYEKMGFIREFERPGYKHGIAYVYMRKHL